MMDTLFGAVLATYAAWGLLFVGFLVVWTILEVTFLEFENGTGATWTLLVAAAAAWWMSAYHFSLVGALRLVPATLGYLAVYFLIGAGWSLVKWYFYTLRLRDEYNADPAHYRRVHRTIPPSPTEYTKTILMWIGHWPFSLLWTLVNDPVKRIVRWIYARLQVVYAAISGHNFAGVKTE